MLNRIKHIFQVSSSSLIEGTSEEKKSSLNGQILSIFEYFLEKLCSEKQSIRSGALRIFNRLFVSSLPLSHLHVTGVDEQLLNQLAANVIDLNELIDAFKRQTGKAYDGVQDLLVKYFRRAVCVETNLDYLNVYVRFILEHLPSQSESEDVEMASESNQKMVRA